MNCSNFEYNETFKGAYLDKSRYYFYFGKRPYGCSYSVPLKEDSERYTKPIEKGLIGLYFNTDGHDSVNVCHMNVYINMVPASNAYSYSQILPYVCYQPRKNYNTLKYSFGKVTEGLEELEELLKTTDHPLIINNCGISVTGI